MNMPHHYRLKEAPWHQSQVPLRTFLEGLPSAPRRLLMLDYDGTLAPFQVQRDQAHPYAEVIPVLQQLAEQDDTRIVLVSGRRTEEVLALMPLAERLEVWGGHGWERKRPGAPVERIPLPEAAAKSLTQARQKLEDLGGALETKPASVAVHWRGAPPETQKALGNRVLRAWLPLTESAGGELEIHRFDGGMELRCQGRTKGDVVEQVLAEEPDGVLAAYLGDDLTDEDAFCSLGDRGLGVLVRPEPRQSEARAWLRPPGELVLFLECWRTHS